MVEVNAKVTGLKELNDRLAHLAKDVADKHVRGAVAAGAGVIKTATQNNIDKLGTGGRSTGTLRKAVYTKWLRNSAIKGRVTFLISLKRGKKKANAKGKRRNTVDAYYWWWIENGHIAVGPGGALRGGEKRRKPQRAALKAAGKFVPARPFLRPALSQNIPAITEAVRSELANRIRTGMKK